MTEWVSSSTASGVGAFDPATRVAFEWLLHVDPVAADRLIALRQRALAGDIAARAELARGVEEMRSRYAQRGARRHSPRSRS